MPARAAMPKIAPARSDGPRVAAAQEPADGMTQRAYSAFKSAIRDSEFAPGEQVSAQALAEKFGMSRTPVQEAALRLQQEGLVKILPKRGIQICALAPADVRAAYDIVIALEAAAAELLAAMPLAKRRIAAGELADETARMADAARAQDLTRWGKADAAFHHLLVAHCGNDRIGAIIGTLNDQTHRARMMTLPLRDNLALSVREHRWLIAAIRAGKPDEAHGAARAHRRRAQAEIMPLLERLGLKHL